MRNQQKIFLAMNASSRGFERSHLFFSLTHFTTSEKDFIDVTILCVCEFRVLIVLDDLNIKKSLGHRTSMVEAVIQHFLQHLRKQQFWLSDDFRLAPLLSPPSPRPFFPLLLPPPSPIISPLGTGSRAFIIMAYLSCQLERTRHHSCAALEAEGRPDPMMSHGSAWETL